MAQRISYRDWEQLSAYLDGQLNPRDRARLEERLKSQPELEAELQALRRLHTTLWRAPRLRAPRNFTLSAQKLGLPSPPQPVPRRLFPAFGFTSALAALALVMVLVFDMLQAVTPAAAPPSAASLPVLTEEQVALLDASTPTPVEKQVLSQEGVEAASAPMHQDQPEQALDLASPLTATLEVTETVVVVTEQVTDTKRVLQVPVTVPVQADSEAWIGMGGVGGGSGESPAPDVTDQSVFSATEEVMLEAEPASTLTPAPEVTNQSESNTAEGQTIEAESAPTPTPAPTLPPRPPTETPAAIASAPETLPAAPLAAEPGVTVAPGAVAPDAVAPDAVAPQPAPSKKPFLTTVRAVEIVLAALILVSGVVALYLYRRKL